MALLDALLATVIVGTVLLIIMARFLGIKFGELMSKIFSMKMYKEEKIERDKSQREDVGTWKRNRPIM